MISFEGSMAMLPSSHFRGAMTDGPHAQGVCCGLLFLP